jgi:hypothetical protein
MSDTEYSCECGNVTSPFEQCPNCEPTGEQKRGREMSEEYFGELFSYPNIPGYKRQETSRDA